MRVIYAPKPCEQCGAPFEKPWTTSARAWILRRFCSVACKNIWLTTQPGPNVGRTFPDAVKHFLPCRICGGPTRYRGTTKTSKAKRDMLRCDQPECVEQSKRLKNERIAKRARAMYRCGARQRLIGNWSRTPRVSTEEVLLTPWFTSLGWVTQHSVPTGVHTNKLPRQFKLDFALPALKLYVEIDGTIHRHADRRERDARRDRMLSGLGWRGLRIDAKTVREDRAQVQESVHQWMLDASTTSGNHCRKEIP